MPIYLIKRTDRAAQWEYDTTVGAVVIAPSTERAIALAKDQLDEIATAGPEVWNASIVTQLDPNGEPRVVLVDFRAG